MCCILHACTNRANKITIIIGKNYYIHTGIGPVLNLRFSSSFATIMWDPPQTVGVLSNITYYLTVTMNTDVVIINTTTTDTTHSIIYPQLCVDYAVCVAAFSPEYRGRSVFITKRTPGSK